MTARRDDEFARMCRMDGQKPTARDKWRAFYRLWRIARGRGAHQDMAAADCFRVLFASWGAIRLLGGYSDYSLVNTSRVPKFLRKRLLDDPRLSTLRKFAEAVGVPVAELLVEKKTRAK